MSLDPRRKTSGLQSFPATAEEQLATARRQIEACEAALEESEARFRHVIERNGDAIVVVGHDGLVRYANTMAGRLFGVEPAKLNGTPFGFPLSAGETTEVDVIAGNMARQAEMRVVDSVWDGSPVCLASLRDITDRETLRRERAAQLAAQLAAERINQVISQAPVAMAVLRGTDHRYEITNRLYDELIGRREVIGKPLREALPELEGQGIYELMGEVYASGRPYVGTELRLMIDRGSGPEERFFTFVYQPLRDGDKPPWGVAIVATDVTDHVRARAEAEKANKAKSDFLATMSHELRTPLNAIGGYADLLLAEIRGPISDPQRADLERINRSQRHLLSVINDILNFAKVEAGRLGIELREVSMNAVLGELEALVNPMLMQKQIAYEYRCCDPKFTARTDPERVQQILLNLLSNAAKFTPAGGSIVVECAPTTDAMLVKVTDTGSGIPEDKLQKVFEPFVQLERGQAPELGGTGLGLSISRDLARAMGGDLTLESEPGRGSTFTLRLPRVANSAGGA